MRPFMTVPGLTSFFPKLSIIERRQKPMAGQLTLLASNSPGFWALGGPLLSLQYWQSSATQLVSKQPKNGLIGLGLGRLEYGVLLLLLHSRWQRQSCTAVRLSITSILPRATIAHCHFFPYIFSHFNLIQFGFYFFYKISFSFFRSKITLRQFYEGYSQLWTFVQKIIF
jgi:hypothetical protein